MYEKFLFPLAKHVAIIVVVGFVIVANPELTLAQSPPSGCVWAYNDINYQGSYEQFCGDTNFVGSNWNDAVMSIQIPAGYRAVIYSDADYGGNSEVFWHHSGWSKDLRNADTAPAIECAGTWDRCLSSLKVCADGTCPPTNPASQEANYEATYLAKKSYPNGTITMEPGSTETVWIEFTNSGSTTWPGSITRLGTVNPDNHDDLDYNSPFAHHTWVNGNSLVRPAWLDNPVVLGATGRFEFIIQAPTTPGSYKFVFRPVVEGKAWMDEYGYWDIEVVIPDCKKVADGICLRKRGESYIGIADLTNPDVELKLAYKLDDDSDWEGEDTKFEMKTIADHENDAARDYYHVAINGSAYNGRSWYNKFPCDGTISREAYKDQVDVDMPNINVDWEVGFNLPSVSGDSGIDVGLYRRDFFSHLSIKNQLVKIGGRASVFVYKKPSIANIYGAYFDDNDDSNNRDFLTQDNIPWSQDKLEDDEDHNIPLLEEAQNEIKKYIQGSVFSIGYNSTLIYNGEIVIALDEDDRDHLTAIGVSEDGTQILLASTYKKKTKFRFAEELLEAGAYRAMLLDGGGSAQISTMGQTKGTTLHNRNFEEDKCGNKPRKFINAIIVSNKEKKVNAEIQKKILDKGGHNFKLNDNDDEYKKIVVHFYDLVEKYGRGGMSRNRSDIVNLEYKPHFLTDTYPLEHVNHFFTLSAYLDDGTPLYPSSPYTLTVGYDQEDVWYNVNESNLALYHHNGNEWVKEPTSVVDIEANTVTAKTNDLGLWAILAEMPPATLTIVNGTDQSDIEFSLRGYKEFSIPFSQSETITDVYYGRYVIGQNRETLPYSDWVLADVVCETQDGTNVETQVDHYQLTAEVTVDPDQDITCTFTNAKISEVEKLLPALTIASKSNAISNTIDFSIDSKFTFPLMDGTSLTFGRITSETHTITQDPATMPDEYWALVSVTCEDQQGQAVEPLVDHDNFQAEIPVRAGQHVSCTFLNEPADYSSGTPPQAIFLPIIIKQH